MNFFEQFNPALKAEVVEFIKTNCLTTGIFTLSSDQISTKFFDMKSFMLNTDMLDIFVMALSNYLEEMKIPIQTLAGSGVGGAMLVPATLNYLAGTEFYIPKGFVDMSDRPKLHGNKATHYGCIKPFDNVFLIEDVLTTGASLEKLNSYVYEQNARVVGHYVLLDRSNNPIIRSFLKERDFD